MDSPFFLILVGFLYIVLFGGLSLLRREGLSIRFALESIAIIILFAGISFFSETAPHPVFFLLVLYLVTMRTRWMVDLAIFFARRKYFTSAEFLYSLAGKLWPDQPNRINIDLNHSVTFLQRGSLDEAIELLNHILDSSNTGYLGIKNEAAAHYNLGVAYLKKKMVTQARNEFQAVIETAPASIFARRAEEALNKNRPPEE